MKRLTERSIAKIKAERVYTKRKYLNSDSIYEVFELWYELEYKHSMLTTQRFEGLPQRYDNTLKIIQEKAKEVNRLLADTFIHTFNYYLKVHDLSSAKRWAYNQTYIDGEGHMVDRLGFDDALSVLEQTYERYIDNVDVIETLIRELLLSGKSKSAKGLLDYAVMIQNESMKATLEDGVEEFNDVYESFIKNKFENYDDAEEWIDFNFSEFDKDFINIHGSIENAIAECVYLLEEFDIFGDTDILAQYVDPVEFINEGFEIIVFPAWSRYWISRGLKSVITNVQMVLKELKQLDRIQIGKQFAVINIATNTTHQTGSIMDYYGDLFNIYSSDLKKLSNYNTRVWDKELEEIGVRF